jgi:hypothetical protein
MIHSPTELPKKEKDMDEYQRLAEMIRSAYLSGDRDLLMVVSHAMNAFASDELRRDVLSFVERRVREGVV